MLEREVQLLNIELALVKSPNPVHEAGMLEREVQPENIEVAAFNVPNPVHEAGMPNKLEHP